METTPTVVERSSTVLLYINNVDIGSTLVRYPKECDRNYWKRDIPTDLVNTVKYPLLCLCKTQLTNMSHFIKDRRGAYRMWCSGTRGYQDYYEIFKYQANNNKLRHNLFIGAVIITDHLKYSEYLFPPGNYFNSVPVPVPVQVDFVTRLEFDALVKQVAALTVINDNLTPKQRYSLKNKDTIRAKAHERYIKKLKITVDNK